MDINHLLDFHGNLVFQEAHDIFVQHFGEAHPQSIATLSNIATLYQATGNVLKAEPLEENPFKSLIDAWLNHVIGTTYLKRGDSTKAEPILKTSHEIFAVNPENNLRLYRISRASMLELYQALGKPELAAEYTATE